MIAANTIGPYSVITQSAMEAVLVANTPSFLLDRLRKDVGVQTVASSMDPEQILPALIEAVKGAPSDVMATVAAYVYLTALSWSDPEDGDLSQEIASLDLKGLEWGDTIRDLILAEAVPTHVENIHLSDPLPK